MQDKQLELVFKTAEGDTKVVTITDPRDDITKEEAYEVMQTLIDSDVIECSGGSLAEIVEARMRITQVNVLV